MAAKRNKSQAKRNVVGRPLPGWAWLAIGLALGIGIFLLAPKFLGGGEGFFRPQPNADAKPPALDAGDGEPIVDNNAPIDNARDNDGDYVSIDGAAEEQDYAFYNLLSGEEKPISDAELEAKARAEATRAEQARRDAADAADRDASSASANDSDAADAADTGTKPPNAIDTSDTPSTARDATAAANDSSAASNARYLLQAGAFKASGDAEALKAKIAFLGLSARVESAQIKGATVYRVRMGPYGSATELADAKRKLAGGGLPAMAIKVR
jgi:cell division protein FtsN